MASKSLTFEEKLYIKSIKSLIGKTKDVDKIVTSLKERGFVQIDSGAYKYVLRRGDDPYCVKVYRYDTSWEYDSFKVPRHLSKYYLHPIFINKQFIIQKWAEKKWNLNKKDVKKIPNDFIKKNYWNYDLHCANIRIDGNKEVIIDFCHRS